eukprot:1672559-Amphidinium_carterae.1
MKTLADAKQSCNGFEVTEIDYTLKSGQRKTFNFRDIPLAAPSASTKACTHALEVYVGLVTKPDLALAQSTPIGELEPPLGFAAPLPNVLVQWFLVPSEDDGTWVLVKHLRCPSR